MTRLTGALAGDARGLSFDRFSVTTHGQRVHARRPHRAHAAADAPRPPGARAAIRASRNGAASSTACGRSRDGGRSTPNCAARSIGSTRTSGCSPPSGGVRAALVLNTAVPGWRAAGHRRPQSPEPRALARPPDRPSDITGRTTFDLALELGRAFPRGTYAFDGPHAAFLGYEGDDVRARGTITPREALVDDLRARAYGADVTASASSIGLDEPFPFAFRGTASGVDLRRVPRRCPSRTSRAASRSTTTSRAALPIRRSPPARRFGASEFLGAAIAAGTIGTIDTTASPIRFSGDGGVDHLDLNRLGDGLDVAWLREPRYGGTVARTIPRPGLGRERAELTLCRRRPPRARRRVRRRADRRRRLDRHRPRHARGRLRRTLHEHRPGRSARRSPLSGAPQRDRAGCARRFASCSSERRRSPTTPSTPRPRSPRRRCGGSRSPRAASTGALRDGVATSIASRSTARRSTAHGAGTVAFDPERASNFQYDIARADLATLGAFAGAGLAGAAATTGRATGAFRALRFAGGGSMASAVGREASTRQARRSTTT